MAVAGITAVVGAVQKMVNLGSSIINISSSFETVKTGLKTATGSAKEAEIVFEQIRKLSYATTFGMEELSQAATYLLNAGQGTNQINKTLLMLGNLAQGDKTKFLELSDIYTKVLNIGKANSLQINQLAIRGIPIKQTLKEIGVQGTATAEEFTTALQKMTDEGGKFAGAMDNLNDTIAGKEDFVSDTIKEIAVNFGELSGLTDVYKTALEGMRGALDKVNNVLIEINKNPLLKSIISGVLAGLLTSIGIILSGKIISALISIVNVLKSMVVVQSVMSALTGNFAGLATAAVVAGVAVAGITTITNLAKDSAEEHANTVKTENEELEKKAKLLKLLGELPVDSLEYADTSNQVTSNSISELKSEIEKLKKEAESVGNNIGEGVVKYSSPQDWASQNGRLDLLLGNPQTLQNEYEKSISEETNQLKQQYSLLQKRQRILEDNLLVEQAMFDIQKQNSETDSFLTSLIEDKYEKENSELNKLQETLKKVNEARYATTGSITYNNGKPVVDEKIRYEIDPSYKQSVDNAEKYINDKIHDIKVKIAVEQMGDWQKVLQKTLGLTDEEATKISGGNVISKNGMEMVDAYNAKWNGYLSNDLGDSGTKSLEYLGSAVSAVEALSKANFNLKGSEKFTASDNSVKTLMDTIDTQFDEVFEPIKANGLDLANMNDRQKESVSTLLDTYNSLLTLLGETDPLVQKLKEKLQSIGVTDKEETENTSDNSKFDIQKWFDSVAGDLHNKFKEGTAVFTDYLDYAAASMVNSVASMSSDMNNFMQGFQNSGIWGGIIAAFVGALANVCSDIDGFEEALNPITAIVSNLSQLIADVMSNITSSNKIIFAIAKVINTILKILKPFTQILLEIGDRVASFIEWVADGFESLMSSIFFWVETEDELSEAQQEEAERLKALTDAYSSLYDAIKEQEEYYLEKKSEINGSASIDSAYKVNDMILTPSGTFSTHPEDTIMAMKHPEDLMSKGASVILNINNNAGVEVQTSQTTDANGNTVIDIDMISAKVASDYATGANGWDSAYVQQNYQQQGRILAL